MEKMFEMAVRNKFRFPFRGMISVEDLWDLGVENLDSIFRVLNSQIKKEKEESLLTKKTQEENSLECKIAIVKYIFECKVNETNAKLAEASRKAKKQKIMEIMEIKQNEDLQNKSLDDLSKMLEEL